MKRKRNDIPEERRKQRVEMNLLSDEETETRSLARVTRGCTLPFTIGLLVVGAGLEVLRSVLG